MSLPSAWVDRIFSKLALAYGRDFLARWEGQDLNAVKADWAEELAGYAAHPCALKYGLENLRADKPPTARAFKALCNTVPVASQMALPAPHEKPPEAVRKRLESIGQVSGDPKAWARKLKAREEQGDRLTAAQRSMWRTALESEEAPA